jgi:hypothetical protein
MLRHYDEFEHIRLHVLYIKYGGNIEIWMIQDRAVKKHDEM